MLTKFYPPQKMNGWYGYRTGLSRQSQKHWDFAQTYSTRLMLISGLLLLGLWLALSFSGIVLGRYAKVIVLLCAGLIPIFLTQQALKKL